MLEINNKGNYCRFEEKGCYKYKGQVNNNSKYGEFD